MLLAFQHKHESNKSWNSCSDRRQLLETVHSSDSSDGMSRRRRCIGFYFSLLHVVIYLVYSVWFNLLAYNPCLMLFDIHCLYTTRLMLFDIICHCLNTALVSCSLTYIAFIQPLSHAVSHTLLASNPCLMLFELLCLHATFVSCCLTYIACIPPCLMLFSLNCLHTTLV